MRIREKEENKIKDFLVSGGSGEGRKSLKMIPDEKMHCIINRVTHHTRILFDGNPLLALSMPNFLFKIKMK